MNYDKEKMEEYLQNKEKIKKKLNEIDSRAKNSKGNSVGKTLTRILVGVMKLLTNNY